jgi:hypothetical protein
MTFWVTSMLSSDMYRQQWKILFLTLKLTLQTEELLKARSTAQLDQVNDYAHLRYLFTFYWLCLTSQTSHTD